MTEAEQRQLASLTSLTKAKLALDTLCRGPHTPDWARLLAVVRQGLNCYEALNDCETLVCRRCDVALARDGRPCGC